MNAPRQLHDLGQSLCRDNITRGLLTSGSLRRYIAELSVTGVTSSPSIFNHAIKNSGFYDVEALAAPATINSMPEKTLHVFAEHGEMNGALPIDGGDAEAALDAFAQARVDDAALAAQLQRQGTESFDKSWNDLLGCIASKGEVLKKAAPAGRQGVQQNCSVLDGNLFFTRIK